MRGVTGLRRDAGVGVDMAMDMEVDRKGSEFALLHDELDRGG